MDRVFTFIRFDLAAAYLVYCVPSHVQHVLVGKAVENAVTPQDYEVMEVRLKTKL